jgi:hypothetical protein
MIPRYDIDVDPTVPPTATFWVPAPGDLEESGGIGDFHDTELIVTDLEEAGAVLEAEREAIEYLDAKSSTPRKFDDLAAAIEWEAPDMPSDEAPDFFDQEDAWYGLNGLEVGVAGLVYAMNAVGIVTAASCRSHHQASPLGRLPDRCVRCESSSSRGSAPSRRVRRLRIRDRRRGPSTFSSDRRAERRRDDGSQ